MIDKDKQKIVFFFIKGSVIVISIVPLHSNVNTLPKCKLDFKVYQFENRLFLSVVFLQKLLAYFPTEKNK